MKRHFQITQLLQRCILSEDIVGRPQFLQNPNGFTSKNCSCSSYFQNSIFVNAPARVNADACEGVDVGVVVDLGIVVGVCVGDGK